MAATHKSLKASIERHIRVIQIFVEDGDAEQAGFVARMAARDAFKMMPALRERTKV